MYRKYKVGTTISAQNLSQLEETALGENYRTTILGNCGSKIFTGNGDPEELEWWVKEFGARREWKFNDTIDFKTGEYDSKHGNVEWKFVNYFTVGKLQTACNKTNRAAFKIRQENGKALIGNGKFSYLNSKYKEKQILKTYDFEKFLNSSTETTSSTKFNPNDVGFENTDSEIDPVQTDLDGMFNSEDSLIIKFKKN